MMKYIFYYERHPSATSYSDKREKAYHITREIAHWFILYLPRFLLSDRSIDLHLRKMQGTFRLMPVPTINRTFELILANHARNSPANDESSTPRYSSTSCGLLVPS